MEEARKLCWTPQHIQRFWDYWAARPDAQAHYFAYQVGTGVCRFLEHVRPLRNQQVLDFGAGPGHLTGELLHRGAWLTAVDYSQETVATLREQFACERLWRGAYLFDGQRLPFDDQSFDIICCLETVEHLLHEHCDRVLAELFRVLKVGGTLLVTTPHKERLQQQHVFCPECCSVFHRWQHVQSWTADALRRELSQHGFQVEFCRGMSFHDFQPMAATGRMFSWKGLRRACRYVWHRSQDWLWPRDFPRGRAFQARLGRKRGHHLAAVAQRPASQQRRTQRAA